MTALPRAPETRPVIQGTFEVTDDPQVMLTTILGSCVSLCLYDLGAGVGGMNHFLLPSRDDVHQADVRFGTNAIELMINALLKQGADRTRFRAKLFGGSAMTEKLQDIGQANAHFARSFLTREGILCTGESLGGTKARKVRFWPATGRAQAMEIPNHTDPVQAMPRTETTQPSEVTLF